MVIAAGDISLIVHRFGATFDLHSIDETDGGTCYRCAAIVLMGVRAGWRWACPIYHRYVSPTLRGGTLKMAVLLPMWLGE